jgi:hypothetical protein
MLRNVIISYPKLFEPTENLSGKLQYSAQIVIPKDHPQLKELQGKVLAVAKSAFPKVPLKALRIGLRDNDKDTGSDGEVRSARDPRLAGTMFVNANANVDRPPQVIDRSATRILTSDRDIYAGCRINISLSMFSYDTQGAKGVGFGLGNIQLMEAGERWDGRRSAFEEFENEGEDEAALAAAPATGAVKAEAAEPEAADDAMPWD